jgi:Na+/H+-dicarboxylate symporter
MPKKFIDMVLGRGALVAFAHFSFLFSFSCLLFCFVLLPVVFWSTFLGSHFRLACRRLP